MKSKLLFFGLLSLFAFALVASTPDIALGQGAFDYQPLEQIPGASDAKTFPQYIEGIYKFGIWTVGLAALFMLSVGGFIYLSSGGNTATIGKAKTYITDSLIGLILAILAYLILYVINPDLVTVNLGRFNEAGGRVVAPATATTPVVPNGVRASANETLSNATAYAKNPGSIWYPDAAQDAAVASLNAYGIVINGTKGTEKLCKKEGQESSCTSLYKIRPDVISTMTVLGNDCKAFNGGNWCTISITGGTEYWKHSKETKHIPGNPVIDIGKNSSSDSFFKYLQSVKPNPTCKRGGRNVYTIPIKTNFGLKYLYLWDEDNIHWHANVNVDMCH